MTYNEKKKVIERNMGKIYANFDVHGMLNYVSEHDKAQNITDTIQKGYHINHRKALAALSNLIKESLKVMIDKDYNSLIENNIKKAES